ncbi:hypothetical protein ACFP8Y_09855 [Pseudomonas karstica]
MEFIKNSRFQSTERLVVKLFAAGGKPRPKGALEVLATLEKGAGADNTVQTSKTAEAQRIPALQVIYRTMAWPVHWQKSKDPFTRFGELP